MTLLHFQRKSNSFQWAYRNNGNFVAIRQGIRAPGQEQSNRVVLPVVIRPHVLEHVIQTLRQLARLVANGLHLLL